MTVIGLCGNIASGKSLAAAIMSEWGAKVIDTDRISREVVEIGQPAYIDIVKSFGSDYLEADGSIDRRKLASLVFTDENSRQQLNQITHPRIREQALLRIVEAKSKGTKVVVLEVPLLIEAGFDDLVDQIWLVRANKQRIYQRIIKRDQISMKAATARLASQMTAKEQSTYADIIIENNGNIEQLRRQLWKRYQEINKEK